VEGIRVLEASSDEVYTRAKGVLRGVENEKKARDTAVVGRICMCPVPSRRGARAGHDTAVP